MENSQTSGKDRSKYESVLYGEDEIDARVITLCDSGI